MAEQVLNQEQVDHLVKQGSEFIHRSTVAINRLTVLLELLAKDTQRSINSTIEDPEIEKITLAARKRAREADLAEADARVHLAQNVMTIEAEARLEAANALRLSAVADREEAEARRAEAQSRKARANLEQLRIGQERAQIRPKATTPVRPPTPQPRREVDRRKDQSTPLGAPIKGIEGVKIEEKPAEKASGQ